MLILIMKNITNNVIYIAQKLHALYNSFKNLYIHSRKKKLWMSFSWKADLRTITIPRILNILPKGESSSDSNLIIMKYLLYSIGSPLFIASIWFLVLSQSYVYLPNTSLLFPIEANIKYLSLLLSWMYLSSLLKIK